MIQTFPVGLILFILSQTGHASSHNNGFKNWEFMLSGIFMGFVYHFGTKINSNVEYFKEGMITIFISIIIRY